MATIWKFSIPLAELDDFISVEMPVGANVLSVGNQDETLCFWALVDPTAPKTATVFKVIGTGNPVPGRLDSPFLGTVMFMGGKFVVHVFKNGPPT